MKQTQISSQMKLPRDICDFHPTNLVKKIYIYFKEIH